MGNFEFVKSIINEWDPVGLLDLGCPEDEYTPEIKEIVSLLPNIVSAEQLALEIRQVFIKWFKEYIPLDECYSVAHSIWDRSHNIPK